MRRGHPRQGKHEVRQMRGKGGMRQDKAVPSGVQPACGGRAATPYLKRHLLRD